jgi:uncharacterized protein (DUF433 family)
MHTVHSIDTIVSDPNIRGGRPHIAGTTITVADVVVMHIGGQQSVDDIAADHDLPLAHVYAALAYYYTNKAEIDASIKDRRHIAQQMKENRVGSRHKSLFG